MKIAVLSDTHGNYPLAVKILGLIPDLDCIIHLGDTLDDAEILECALDCPTISVAGNCDTDPSVPREILLTFNDMTILATHGDTYAVKSGIDRLRRKASALKAKAVLYGHTHNPFIHVEDGILFVNPGCLKKSAAHLSYAILTIENGTIDAHLVPVVDAEPAVALSCP
jgi:uncharacterized protein